MKLIIFDVEGVVFDDYYVFHVAKNLGFTTFFKFLLYSALYKLNVIDVEEAFKNIYRSFKGASRSVFIQSYKELKLMDGWTRTAEVLLGNDYKIAFVSIGFPNFLLRRLAKEIHSDPNLIYGINLVFTNGRFSGHILGRVTDCGGKSLIVEELSKQLNLSNTQIVTVSNDRNNICMFKYASLNIGFKPDLKMRGFADVLVGGKDIELIIPSIIKDYEGKTREYPKNYKREVLRQSVHMSAFLALTMWILSPLLLFVVLLSMTVAYIFSESLRMDGIFISPITKITQRLGRKGELHLYVVSPVYLVVGILTPLLLFAPPISYVAVSVLAFGDSISTLVGFKFGRHYIPYNKSKSFEGSISGLIVAFSASCLFVSPFFAIVAALTGMIIESLPLPFNDNISIPLSVGIILLALGVLI